MADESLASFLEKLGLGDTIDALKKEDIDLDLLQTLTAEDLKDTGISLGKRLKIIDAIKTKGRYVFLCFIAPLCLLFTLSLRTCSCGKFLNTSSYILHFSSRLLTHSL